MLCSSNPAGKRPHPTQVQVIEQIGGLRVLQRKPGGHRAWGCGGPLPVELPRAGKFMPSLEMVGNGLVQQPARRMARVVEFGFCTGLPARLRMR
jgi:hypothetical protein